ncbi:MAG: helix-turn-helix transcriptional regulator [Fibrella sp.]|nr:helix-turn-helix transcriptional regulator [Armatimonadota bacterium]
MPFTDLRFLHSRSTPYCTARVDKQFVGYHTLQFAETGSVELFYGDTHHVLDSGTLWTACPGPRIRFHPAPGHADWNHRYAAFTGPRVADWIASGIWFTVPQPLPVSPDFIARFDRLIETINRADDRFSHARAVNLLEGILLELAENRERPLAERAEPVWLAPLLQEMNRTDFHPSSWAKANGMALATLRRHFKAATGIPLHEYTLQQRLAGARSLLADTDIPVKAIAETLGYKDVYFFTRQFRQMVGIPPATFRKSRQ